MRRAAARAASAGRTAGRPRRSATLRSGSVQAAAATLRRCRPRPRLGHRQARRLRHQRRRRPRPARDLRAHGRSRARASRSRRRRRCCSPASTSTRASTACSRRRRRRGWRTSSARGSPTPSATTAGSSCSSSTASKLHIKPSHLDVGRPLVRALRRAGRLLHAACCRSSGPSSRCPPASRGCRSGGSRVLHARRLRAVGLPARRFIGKQAARQLGRLEGQPALRRLRGRRADRRRRRLPRRPLAARPRREPAADAPAGLSGALPAAPRARARRCCTGPPSCCRSPPPATRRSCPWLLGWPYARPRPRAAQGLRGRAARGHGGGAAGRAARRGRRAPRAASTAGASVLVARLVRAAGDRRAARSSGRSSGAWARPPTIAAGLLLGVGGDGGGRRARPRRGAAARRPASPTRCALGVAQACALVPGVSRNGATLAAARARGFDRADANALSRHVALPVIVGATALKGARLARRGLPAGAGARLRRRRRRAAFVSTLGLGAAHPRGRARPLARALRRLPRALAALVLRRAVAESARDERRLRRRRRRHRPGRPRRRRPRRRPAHDRARPARRARSLPSGHYASRSCASPPNLGHRDVDRRRRLEARRRRAGRPLRDGRHRLRGDERQRPHLRRRRADRDARLPRRRAGRPGGAARASPRACKVGAEAAGVEIPGGELAVSSPS